MVSTVSPDNSLRLALDPRLSIPDVGDGLGDRAVVVVVLKDSESPLRHAMTEKTKREGNRQQCCL